MNSDVTRTLHELADHCGVATSYTGQDGSTVTVDEATIIFTLRELGVDIPSDGVEAFHLDAALATMKYHKLARMIPPTVTARAQRAQNLTVNCVDGERVQVTAILEDGSEHVLEQLNTWVPPETVSVPAGVASNQKNNEATETNMTFGTATFQLPKLPAGWHTLRVQAETTQAEATLLVSPDRLSKTQELLDNPATGVMAQLYSVRDTGAWGLGDYATIGALGRALNQLGGADFLLVNPMHAAEVAIPVEDSPYLPTTRRYSNPIYLRIENIPEYRQRPELHDDIAQLRAGVATANDQAELLDRNAVWAAKLQALAAIYEAGLPVDRLRQLQEFIDREGEGLEGFVTWCQASAGDWSNLGANFWAWVQMLCQEQELAAQNELKQYQRIGLLADLAVGVHPGGADARSLEYVLAPGASVGAPPDGYNQQGQDWSQPPWHPWKLAEHGYLPWRDMLRTILRTAGGIRVDHVLGLFRLWWIPRMQSPTTGTYVHYDHEAMVGALILEAERAGAVVVGEDLGTFEPWVQQYLADRHVLGTTVVWFEGDANGPKSPDRYRELSLTSVTTHDLPPTASYLRGGHITLREELGVLTTTVEEEFSNDAQWQVQVLSKIAQAGAFAGLPFEEYSARIADELQDPVHGRDNRPGGADGLGGDNPGNAHSSGIIEGMHRFLALTPSAMRCVALADMVGDVRAQNQPGTTQDVYPNWRIPLCDHDGNAVTVEDLPNKALARNVLRAARG
ncbi:4-alpha-glucanotransferase [Corynebacterium auriscanis]|uniref:4-alpha-glucanotransferase n=1 Tax=Corynebacterium auriscanis TaxID=99807 RepID=A0A0A2DQE4_9CORY|nr:4-alpha-glucanotransferase [Corynebacterium auriscanis]KGM19091.1 4-alpha-glucanotransferase [Corynebacterium auriscanis]MCX2163387.1 4-alpha-glucanotransferase [Corynebacterium auriscanis]WJY72356.1 4-alpha-glucanotransferase [Corynebacterium auriscanis]